MTYKTIDQAVKSLEGASLFRLVPLVGVGNARNVLLAKDVYSVMQPPWPPGKTGSRWALARQVLDSFVLGEFVTIAAKPFEKDPHAIVARVNPENEHVWDFRCLDPKPGVRIFGCFASCNTYIGLTWDFRENLIDGGFKREVKKCKAVWTALFGNLQPYSGNSLNDYVSRNYRAV